MFRHRVFIPFVSLLCLQLVTNVNADTSPAIADRQMSFSRTLELTLARNPSLIAAGFNADIARAQIVQAGLRPNPQLDVLVENIVGSDRFSRFDSAETTVSLSWVIERGKRARRVDFANAEAAMTDIRQQIRRLDVASETALVFLECLRLQENLRQSKSAIALAKSTLEAIKRRVRRGRSPRADQARAEAELARMYLLQEEYEHSKLVAYRKLAAQWGSREPAFNGVVGNLDALPSLPEFDALVSNLGNTPEQALFLSEQRLRESELRLEQAKAKRNWRITAGFRRLEAGDDHALVAGITIPLGGFSNKNQGNIARARVKFDQSAATQSASLLAAQTQLFAIHQGLKHSLHEVAALNGDIIPKLELALSETRRAYDAGRYGFQELSLARAALLQAQARRTDAAIGAFSRLIELERLTGLSANSSQTFTGEKS